MWVMEPNLGPLQDGCTALTAEPFLQTLHVCLFVCLFPQSLNWYSKLLPFSHLFHVLTICKHLEKAFHLPPCYEQGKKWLLNEKSIFIRTAVLHRQSVFGSLIKWDYLGCQSQCEIGKANNGNECRLQGSAIGIFWVKATRCLNFQDTKILSN